LNSMSKPARVELAGFAESLMELRFVGRRRDDESLPMYGIFHLDDLRPRTVRK